MRILKAIADFIDGLNERVGRVVSWCALLIVIIQFIVVVMRYIFGVGSIFMQESITYLHAALFLVAGGYTLLHDGHVRVDVFYRQARSRTKAWVNLAGSLLFLLPMAGVILVTAWPYVLNAWAIREGSLETSGIPAVYLLKTLILVFAGLISLQGVSLMLRSVLFLGGHDRLPSGGDTERLKG